MNKNSDKCPLNDHQNTHSCECPIDEHPELERLFGWEQKIVLKAWDDEEFRQKLIEDPLTTIESEFADIPFKFDTRLKVVVHEDTEDTVNLVIPYKATHQPLYRGY